MNQTAIDWNALRPGDPVTPMVVDVDASVIVAGAIATRDFMPVHHDRDYANTQGAPDIFMNILSDNAYCGRFLTDWAGPDAMITHLAIRLGVPLFPGTPLTYTGEVAAVSVEGDELRVDVAFRAVTNLGEHLGGTATLTVPRTTRTAAGE